MKIFKLSLILFLIFSVNNLNASNMDINSKITKNLRCLICQGQSVYDSDSEFAISIKVLVDKKLKLLHHKNFHFLHRYIKKQTKLLAIKEQNMQIIKTTNILNG